MTFTAEREAYSTLLQKTDFRFTLGGPAGFDLRECADNAYSDWIGAQIRADLYGWVSPGNPALAADLARRDAALSHTGDGLHGAALVAALGAAIAVTDSIAEAIELALPQVPADSGVAAAVAYASGLVGDASAVEKIHRHYADLNPVHTLNNLCLVVWALLSFSDDFTAAIGNVVAAGLDTDCNGATVGGLWGLQGKPIPPRWTQPWQGRVAVSLAGVDEISLDVLVERTLRVAQALAAGA
jgi:ADP-ribosylglycohydrolase